MVRERYTKYKRPLVRVVHGLPTSWEPAIATVYDRDGLGAVVWSPCSKFIAVAKPGAVEIRDAVTLWPVSVFESPGSKALHLKFSPDSRSLIRFDASSLITWDVQTGGSIIKIIPEGDILRSSSAYSTDGRMFSVVCQDWGTRDNYITTHDLSTTHIWYRHRIPEGYILRPIWTHGEFLRFATMKPGSITIWQSRFTSTNPPELVESFPLLDEILGVNVIPGPYLFLPAPSRLAIVLKCKLLVWDFRDSKFLLDSPVSPSEMTFSSDGRFLAYTSTDTPAIHVWKETLDGYNLHQRLAFPDYSATPLLSPNGESLVVTGNSITHLWYTKDPTPPSDPTPDLDRDKFILAFSSNEAFVAFVRRGGHTVVIVGLQSGGPQSTIDTGLEVMCLGMTESIVVVADREKIVTWNLTTGNAVRNMDFSRF